MLHVGRHVFEDHNARRVATAWVTDLDFHMLLTTDHDFVGGGHANRQLRHGATRFYGCLGRIGDRRHAADFAFGRRHELHFHRAILAGRELADLPHDGVALGGGVGSRTDELRAPRHFIANRHSIGRLGARVANLHDELGRFADLNLARGKFLNDERWLLRPLERFFAGLARAIASGDGRDVVAILAEAVRRRQRAIVWIWRGLAWRRLAQRRLTGQVSIQRTRGAWALQRT